MCGVGILMFDVGIDACEIAEREVRDNVSVGTRGTDAISAEKCGRGPRGSARAGDRRARGTCSGSSDGLGNSDEGTAEVEDVEVSGVMTARLLSKCSERFRRGVAKSPLLSTGGGTSVSSTSCSESCS